MLGEAKRRLRADTLAHFHIYPLPAVTSWPVSPTEYPHLLPTAELQGFAFCQPLPDVLQLLLDAVRRDLSAHAHRGVRVH